ncbi:MAG: hypothetical protein Q9192_000240 [Flavoplaca navasiana]
MEDIENVGEGFDEWDREAKDEYGVLSGIMEGRVGRGCRAKAVDALGDVDLASRCKNYELANLFPARAVALGVVYVVLEERGLKIELGLREWVKDVGSGKVDSEDFDEVIELLRKT